MNFENYNINKSDVPYLAALTIFSMILVIYYIIFNLKLGIYCTDVYIYLGNSLTFSGVDIKYPGTIYLAPVICFLTSLLFRIGIQGEIAIFIITGIFAIIGNIGFYILLKTRFNKYLSITGAIVYSCLSLNLMWLANGTLDIPAVAITIWVVIYTILAINKDPKYYPIAVGLFLVGFLIRFTEGFILPILFVYFVYKTRFKLEAKAKKYLYDSLIACVVIFLITVLVLFIVAPRNLYFLEIIYNATQGSKGARNNPAYTLDTWFYLKHFLEFISSSYCQFNGRVPSLKNPTPLAYGVIGLLIVGAVLSINKLKQITIKNKKLIIPTVILAIFIMATFTHIIGLVSIVLTLLVILMTYYLLKDSGFKHLELNFLFLTWILVYFMYFTYFNTKVDRYIITLMPAFIYFVIAAVDVIEVKIKIKKVIPIILIALFIVNAFGFAFTISEHENFHNYKEITDILKEMDYDLKNKTVGSSFIRACLWYLQQPITPLLDNNLTAIENSNLTYYIDSKNLTLENYEIFIEHNGIYVYIHK